MPTAVANNLNEIDTLNMRGTLLHNEPMSLHTSWRAGGKCKRAYVPADLDDLADFLRSMDEGEAVYWA